MKRTEIDFIGTKMRKLGKEYCRIQFMVERQNTSIAVIQ